jgi:predicted DsbA family dithiol-disulfide isomerase
MGLIDFWRQSLGKTIVVFADFIDPFCYIGFDALRRQAVQRNLAIEWRGFELNPETPPEGYRLETAGNSDLRPGMWASVRGMALKAGLDFPEPRWIPNTRAAHVILEFAKKTDVKIPLIEAIYQAYFMRQRDIGQATVLSELAAPFGITRKQVESAIADPSWVKRLDSRRQEAQQRGFLGFPGFIYRGKPYFGALSADAWKNILTQ